MSNIKVLEEDDQQTQEEEEESVVSAYEEDQAAKVEWTGNRYPDSSIDERVKILHMQGRGTLSSEDSANYDKSTMEEVK